ncbi:MauE/DoxX family redox-associated membrane protein [Rhizohabitans arisaemae]|uniref:MauE/DoxX family redox-associated membrane protein n=1 Tax=Rhizohabitans arisaemae TaxID=2720610 RepID=UPI0024B0CE82|nr:MauE/DoxX family redox-associated membrane protein [Rhizohabitans arisaemae]
MLAAAVCVVCLGSALGHLRRPAALTAAIRAHAVIPAALAVPAAVATMLAEAAIGLGGVHALLSGSLWLHPITVAAAALMAAFTLYTLLTLRTGGAVPCGCSADRHPVSRWTAWRAGALAVLALSGPLLPARTASELAITLIAGLAFATLLWHLPSAMEVRAP